MISDIVALDLRDPKTATASNRGKPEGGERKTLKSSKKVKKLKKDLESQDCSVPPESIPQSKSHAESCAMLADMQSFLHYSLNLGCRTVS